MSIRTSEGGNADMSTYGHLIVTNALEDTGLLPDMTPESGESCKATAEWWGCTRAPHDDPIHLAGTGYYIGAIWTDPEEK